MRCFVGPTAMPSCPGCGARDWICTEYEVVAQRRHVLSARRHGAATTLMLDELYDSDYVDTQDTEVACRNCGHYLMHGQGWDDLDYT